MIWRSPKASKSTIDRKALPINLCISWVLPSIFPLTAAREVRSAVLRGSMEYSAVTQPLPFPRKKDGISSDTDALHKTWVFPMDTKTDPSAYRVYDRRKWMGLI